MSKMPLIVDIKRCSLEDGPGIRSVVFFKGCPLRCVFCQNPETQDTELEIAFSEEKCVNCGKCAEVCRYGAIDLQSPGRIDRERCTRCGECADACPTSSLRRIGLAYPVEELAEILLRDAAFYKHSGGGVTLSGGECALHPDYIEELFKILKAHGIHIAIETAGYFDYAVFKEKMLPYIDLIYYDVKFADSDLHRKHTGRSNEKILANLRLLLHEEGVEVHPRIPLIPNITATEENLIAIADFLVDAGAESVFLLPYNPLGFTMLKNIGRPMSELPAGLMSPDEEKQICSLFHDIVERKMAQQDKIAPSMQNNTE